MRRTRALRVEDFEYELPAEAVAQVPLARRSDARLLVALDREGSIEHRHVRDLPDVLRKGDVVVVNETRVLPARLELEKSTGGRVEVLLLARHEEPDQESPDRARHGTPSRDEIWDVLIRPARRVPVGTLLYPLRGGEEGSVGRAAVGAVLEVCRTGNRARGLPSADDGVRAVRILEAGVAERFGAMPLPPYIHGRLDDQERYQTVFARDVGSVAAPTAGLHFTADLIRRCERAGADVLPIDLSIGLGTFKPMSGELVEDHVMHAERYRVAPGVLEACRAARRVIAVGTTVLRTLETIGAGAPLEGSTNLFVHGEFDFEIVDVLMTNFHLPRSSLLVLVESFAGKRWRSLYEIATSEGYRFLSFGDAMLVSRYDDAREASTARGGAGR